MTIPTQRFINVNVAFANFVDGESVGDLSIDTNGDVYEWHGSVLGWEALTVSGGAALVSDGVSGPWHNRRIPAAATTHPGNDTNNAAAWTVADDVHKLTITATPATVAGTANEFEDDYCLVCVDAPNGLVAAAFFADAAFDLDGDKMYTKIPLRQRVELPISVTAIRRCDVQPTVICDILIEAQ